MARSVVVIEATPWFQSWAFAVADLLAAVENADPMLVTDEIQEAAAAVYEVMTGYR